MQNYVVDVRVSIVLGTSHIDCDSVARQSTERQPVGLVTEYWSNSRLRALIIINDDTESCGSTAGGNPSGQKVFPTLRSHQSLVQSDLVLRNNCFQVSTETSQPHVVIVYNDILPFPTAAKTPRRTFLFEISILNQIDSLLLFSVFPNNCGDGLRGCFVGICTKRLFHDSVGYICVLLGW